jgi:hypothetical protein
MHLDCPLWVYSVEKVTWGGLVSFNPRADDESIRMNSIAYEYASSITGEIFIAEGVCQQNRGSKRSVGYYLAHVLLTLRTTHP